MSNLIDDPFKRELGFPLHRRAGSRRRSLKPFVVNGRDTGHRITSNAYETLTEHHRPAYPEYDEPAFMRFYLAEAAAADS